MFCRERMQWGFRAVGNCGQGPFRISRADTSRIEGCSAWQSSFAGLSFERNLQSSKRRCCRLIVDDGSAMLNELSMEMLPLKMNVAVTALSMAVSILSSIRWDPSDLFCLLVRQHVCLLAVGLHFFCALNRKSDEA